MNTFTTRRSVRNFNEKTVKKSDLEKIVYAGQCAANGMNRQHLIFVVLQDREEIQRLSKLNAQIMGKPEMDPFYGSSSIIVVFADANDPTYIEDGALAIGNMLNQAHEMHIGSCWIHRAREEFENEETNDMRKKWNIPQSYQAIGHCVLGYEDHSGEKEITSKVVWDL
ncbi:nitroreductase family protein [Catenisphaera adipataccumulans]|uniref:Nitroreductase n=1 Tax=Catenisphaera adipataccumulans TaxID=700500 RepID=A0A7W8FVB7_9FIRM|nr:nitroreductase family protein [Catenisphaera adipataccumulans]MBB5182021.1 nitroreductase [Catenisphaera adipataccumulans]